MRLDICELNRSLRELWFADRVSRGWPWIVLGAAGGRRRGHRVSGGAQASGDAGADRAQRSLQRAWEDLTEWGNVPSYLYNLQHVGHTICSQIGKSPQSHRSLFGLGSQDSTCQPPARRPRFVSAPETPKPGEANSKAGSRRDRDRGPWEMWATIVFGGRLGFTYKVISEGRQRRQLF